MLRKQMGVIILTMAGLLLASVIFLIVLAVKPHTINLEELVKVSFYGYNSVGNAYAKLDETRFGAALAKAKGKKSVEGLEPGAFYACLNAISLELNHPEGLSNGDVVTVDISYDNDAVDDYKIRYSGTSVTVPVQGLAPLTEIDPFADMQMEFSGIAPEGHAELRCVGNAAFISADEFWLDQSDGLKNGDSVTATVPDYDPYTVAQSGYVLTQTEKTYTVAGLPEYLDTFSAIPADSLALLQQETQDMILAFAARDYGSDCFLGEISYAGYVLQVKKPGSDSREHNLLYLIYRGVLSNTRDKFPNTMVYFPVRYSNLMISSEGVIYEDGDHIEGKTDLTDFGIFSYDTAGYTNPYALYKDLVTAKKDASSCETGDGMEGYEAYSPITSLSDIREKDLQFLIDRARERIRPDTVGDSSLELSDVTLVGHCLLSAKTQSDDYRRNNRLLVVYSGTVSSRYFDPVTTYFTIEFEGLVNLPNEEFLYTRESGIRGRTKFPGSYIYGNGYLDGAELFRDLVTSNRADYTYEISEGLKAFES